MDAEARVIELEAQIDAAKRQVAELTKARLRRYVCGPHRLIRRP